MELFKFMDRYKKDLRSGSISARSPAEIVEMYEDLIWRSALDPELQSFCDDLGRELGYTAYAIRKIQDLERDKFQFLDRERTKMEKRIEDLEQALLDLKSILKKV